MTYLYFLCVPTAYLMMTTYYMYLLWLYDCTMYKMLQWEYLVSKCLQNFKLKYLSKLCKICRIFRAFTDFQMANNTRFISPKFSIVVCNVHNLILPISTFLQVCKSCYLCRIRGEGWKYWKLEKSLAPIIVNLCVSLKNELSIHKWSLFFARTLRFQSAKKFGFFSDLKDMISNP